jgi:putative tricarboxylic transport membrane protein
VQLLTFCSFVGMSKEPPAKTISAMMLGFALAAVGLDAVTGTLAHDLWCARIAQGL